MEIIKTGAEQDLEKLEGIIQRNVGAFYELGQALMEIRDRKLYKIKKGGEYRTFEAYCRGTWDINSSRARQLIMATETLENVKSVTIVTPATESQARPLVKLDPEQQREAWQKAVQTAPEGKITAAHVSRIVKELTASEKSIQEMQQRKTQLPVDAMAYATEAISLLQRIADDDPKRQEAFDLVIKWFEEKQN